MAVIHPDASDFSAVAKATLAAAEKLGLPPQVVRTSSDGIWGMALIVPDEVADAFSEFMDSSGAPIRVDRDEVTEFLIDPDTIEVIGEPEEDEEPEAVEVPVKRKPGRPKKVVAQPEPEEEEDSQ